MCKKQVMFDVVQSTPLEPFLAPTSPANTVKTFVKKKQTKHYWDTKVALSFLSWTKLDAEILADGSSSLLPQYTAKQLRLILRLLPESIL